MIRAGQCLRAIAVAGALFAAIAPGTGFAASDAVALPVLPDGPVSSRVLYLENPRFPTLSEAELLRIVETAAGLVEGHFGIAIAVPATIRKIGIDRTFTRVVSRARPGFGRVIADFRSGAVDWARVRAALLKKIDGAPLADQIAFAAPYLTAPLTVNSRDAFADAVTETFRTRVAHWTKATLKDGHSIIGRVPGRPDLPLNEYGYWALLKKLGLEAEIVLTNQLVASVEYIPTPVHTAIRGGITGGAAEYNPRSTLGASAWISLAPFLMEDPQVRALRAGKDYARDDALRYAGILLAHELGHVLLHLGHPWSNKACVMRPAEALDFASWAAGLNAVDCPLGSDPQMTTGAIKIPVW